MLLSSTGLRSLIPTLLVLFKLCQAGCLEPPPQREQPEHHGGFPHTPREDAHESAIDDSNVAMPPLSSSSHAELTASASQLRIPLACSSGSTCQPMPEFCSVQGLPHLRALPCIIAVALILSAILCQMPLLTLKLHLCATLKLPASARPLPSVRLCL